MDIDYNNLPKYGEHFYRDFRSSSLQAQESRQSVRVLVWNIERGYKLPAIIEELKRVNADVLILQEVDIYTGRYLSSNQEKVDIDKEIAETLGMNSVAAVEMSLLAGGIQCNSIMSKYNVKRHEGLVHPSQPIDWVTLGPDCKKNGLGNKYPRKGLRTAAKAVIETPIGDILMYSDHFEMFCNMEGRLKMLGDLLQDCQREQESHPSEVMQIIAGDLNTFCSGLTKLYPRHRSPLNSALFGRLAEDEFWNEAIFSPSALSSPYYKDWSEILPKNLTPPFVDPFVLQPSVDKGWIYKAKIDWALLRGLKCTNLFRGNQAQNLSDHMYLCLDLEKE